MLHRDSTDSGRADRPERPWRHPDADQSSPRYEPDHLRHKPGDTWIIDRARPHDPDDPGPFGSTGWYKDRRTGRHRRDELPDPLPETETGPAEGDRPSPDQPRRRRSEPERPSAQTPQPQRNSRGFGRDERPGRTGWDQEADMSSKPAPYRFDKLREDAWVRFLQKSEPLAAAHRTPHQVTPPVWLRMIRWVIGVVRGSRTVPATNTGRVMRSARPVSVVAPDRHTHLAARTARFAGAVRGAQRARAEAPARTAAARMREVPVQERPWTTTTSWFMSEWERQFDTNIPTGLPDLSGRLSGGAAWA